MKVKKILFFLLLAGNAAQDISQAANEAALSEPPRLERAAQLHKLRKYLEARSLYEEILKDTALSKKEARQIRRHFENLNMKLLFSKTQTPESQIYTVVPGDSLLKISKKYNTTIDLIKRANDLTSDTIYPDMKLKVPRGNFSLLIDKSSNVLTLLLEEQTFKRYRVATGAQNGTPVGQFKIINKLENPTWYKTGAIIPPGSPENNLGTRWIGFDHPGYGIHGTTEPESIGKQSSKGCIRMLNKQVEELYTLIPIGTLVTVKD